MSTRRHTEVEVKFSAYDETQIPDLTKISGVETISSDEVYQLSAVYFDTDDLRLTRSKITLRRRTGGTDAGWHIKFPGKGAREEVQMSLDPSGADELSPPPELISQIRALTRGKGLEPIARVDNERRVILLADSTGTDVAEFSDDHVTAESLLPGGEKRGWREWEFELHGITSDTSWDPGLITSAEEVLTEAGAKQSESPSKLATALGTSVDNVPPLPTLAPVKRKSPEYAVLKALRENLDTMVEYDPKVRADEEDSVHKMRVATRELRSHLQTFEGILNNPDSGHIQHELKDLARVLGRARDAEVVEERFLHLIDSEDAAVVDDAARTRLSQVMGDQYRREHERVIRALDHSRYTDVLLALEVFLATPPEASLVDTDGEKLRSEAAEILLDHLDGTYNDLAAKHDKAIAEWDDLALSLKEREDNFHDVRKAAKKLRYGAEAVGKATSLKTKKLYRATSEVQSILGDFQDCVTSREHLVKTAQRARRAGEDTFGYGVLYQRERQTAHEHLEDYPDAYENVEKAYRKLTKEARKLSKKRQETSTKKKRKK